MFPEKKVAAAIFYDSWLQLQYALLLFSELENLLDCFALSLSLQFRTEIALKTYSFPTLVVLYWKTQNIRDCNTVSNTI